MQFLPDVLQGNDGEHAVAARRPESSDGDGPRGPEDPTGHGDCFCLDVQKGKKEYPVFLYKHEMNFFEPYAENFAACIKRFAGGAPFVI